MKTDIEIAHETRLEKISHVAATLGIAKNDIISYVRTWLRFPVV